MGSVPALRSSSDLSRLNVQPALLRWRTGVTESGPGQVTIPLPYGSAVHHVSPVFRRTPVVGPLTAIIPLMTHRRKQAVLPGSSPSGCPSGPPWPQLGRSPRRDHGSCGASARHRPRKSLEGRERAARVARPGALDPGVRAQRFSYALVRFVRLANSLA